MYRVERFERWTERVKEKTKKERKKEGGVKEEF